MGVTTDEVGGIYHQWEWPRGQAGVEQLDAYLEHYKAVRFVVVDSLAKFRAPSERGMPQFESDYAAVSGLHQVAKRHAGVAILLIAHTRKTMSDDPLDDVSGTLGLNAAVDTIIVLRRHAEGATLHIGGRYWDNDTSEYGLTRGDGRWHLQGAFGGLAGTQIDTVRILRNQGGCTATELASILSIAKQSAGERLKALVALGKVTREGNVYRASL